MAAKSMILRASALTALCAAVVGGVALSGLLSGPANTQTDPVILTQTPSAPPLETAPRPDVSAFGLPCGLAATATAMPGAVVALDVIDPCRPGGRIDIIHAGLTISAKTDATGLLTVDFPALETPAFFTLRNDAGEEAVTLAGLPDLTNFARAAVFWEGDLAIELHAFEGGAEFGTPGHIWQEATGDLADAIIGTGGVLTGLGDATLTAPRLAQVYSIARARRDEVRLSVDVPITPTNCGRPISAQSLHLVPGEQADIRPVTLTLPGCDGVGDYLLLQNLFDDPRLASN